LSKPLKSHLLISELALSVEIIGFNLLGLELIERLSVDAYI